jgi:hypothetical protein
VPNLRAAGTAVGLCGFLEEKHPFEPAGALNSAKTKKFHCMKIKHLDF